MPGNPVSIGCSVLLSPGAAGPPDSGVVVAVTQVFATAGGMPLATAGGTICQMVNSVSGAPYPLMVGSSGASTSCSLAGQGLIRVGDRIPSGPGILTVLGPPAAPFVTDNGAP
jgi:hypothetical protein